MRRAFKPLRVALALGCFALVNAAFLAPLLAAAFCAESGPGAAAAARWQLWPALVAFNVPVVLAILAATVLMGRVYCSTVCPLGVFQDVVFRVRRLFTRKGPGYCAPWNRTRYTVLALSALSLACGALAFPALVEPYSAYGRFVTQLVRPALQWAVNLLAAWGDAHEHYWVMSDDVIVPGFLAFWVAAGSVVFVAAAAAWKGRWFCNAICPVGTILSVAARRPLMRLSIDKDKCVKCGLCARGCKAGCIDVARYSIDNARCVRCFNCLGACKKGAVKL